MTRQQFIEALAEMLETDASGISMDSVLKELPNWDSLATLSFIALADSQLGRTVKGSELVKARTVQDLAALLPGSITD